jgi:hypothetical protein
MTVTLLANNDLVATGFLKAILGWTSNVGADLPDAASWSPDGFVQITSGIGGSSSVYVPRHSPVVSVKCWARNASASRRPPWPKANNTAEAIRAGCFTAYRRPVAVTLPAGYPGASVHSAYLLTEPMRLPNDDSAYACYQFNLQMHWTTGVRS